MSKFDAAYNKVINDVNLSKLQSKVNEIVGLYCDELTGNNTKESPITGYFSGKAYGDGYSLTLKIDNGKALIDPDSSEIVFYKKFLYNHWLNVGNDILEKCPEIKYAEFYIYKD